MWMNQLSKGGCNKLFQSTGIEYLELLRLPYFDPATMIAPDSMHAMYLGLIHDLVSKVWGMDVDQDNSDGKDSLPAVMNLTTLQAVRQSLITGQFDTLCTFPTEYLYQLCFERSLQRPLIKLEDEMICFRSLCRAQAYVLLVPLACNDPLSTSFDHLVQCSWRSHQETRDSYMCLLLGTKKMDTVESLRTLSFYPYSPHGKL